MSENHHRYLYGLLSALMGLEDGLSQLKGLVKQGDDKKFDKYQRELPQLCLSRQELIARVEKVKMAIYVTP